jgi:hypothetical protein
VVVCGLAVTGGRMSWPSLACCAAGAVIAVGYAAWLALRRRGGAGGGEGPGAPEPPAVRPCPGCGLRLGAGLRRCPACGAGLDRPE